MTISQTVTDLQTIHDAITGITTAPVNRPNALETALLPCVLLRPGALILESAGRSLVQGTRTYEGVCLVDAAGQGNAALQETARTIMEAIQARYTTMLTTTEELANGGVVTQYTDAGDAGLLEYGGRQYIGFTFNVTVWLE